MISRKGLLIALLTIVVTITILIYVTRESFVPNKNESTKVYELLKEYGISKKDADTLFLPAKKGLKSYFDIRKDTKSKVYKNNKGESVTIPPLNAEVLRDPRAKVLKTGIVRPDDMSDVKENFDRNRFGRFLPTPVPRRRFDIIPRQIPDVIDLVERARNERLNRTRTRFEIGETLSQEVLIDDEEPDVWSEGARGILINKDSLYMGNKGSLNRFNIAPGNQSFSLANIENPVAVARPHCDYLSAYGMGQASNFRLEIGDMNGRKEFVIVPIRCNNGTSRIEFLNPVNLGLLKTLNLPSEVGSPKWVAHDPITNYTVIPSSDNINSLGLYSIFVNSDNQFGITKILDLPLIRLDGSSMTVRNVTAGTFRADGMLYIASNKDDAKGFYKFGLRDDEKLSFLNRYIDFFDDQIVGISTIKRDIYILIRNNDFGDDNISIIKLIDPLPNTFSWSNLAEVSAYKNQLVQMGATKTQGQCGSCWAFGIVESLADRYSIAKGKTSPTNLSASRLILCDKWRGHCNGGISQWAIDFLSEKGTVLDSCWDYNWCTSDASCGQYLPGGEFETSVTEGELLRVSAPCLEFQNKCITCDNSSGTKVCTEVIDPATGRPQRPFSYKMIEGSLRYLNTKEAMMLEIFNNGPVFASFSVEKDMYTDWGRYTRTGGVYVRLDDYDNYSYGPYDRNESGGSHVVEIVGWSEKTIPDMRALSRGSPAGATMTIKYWICKNSWGPAFGDGTGFWNVAFSDEERGINTGIHLDDPYVINLGIYRENIYGAASILPDTSCPCSYDPCKYRCEYLTLDKQCPGENDWDGTGELCWYD